jgi:ATP-dependent Clp protease ATP-binding subunit ClpC
MSEGENEALTAGAKALVAAGRPSTGAAGTHHWLLALLDRHGAMAESLVPSLQATALRRSVADSLRGGDAGPPLTEETLVQRAIERATARRQSLANERDLASIILSAAGYQMAEDTVHDAIASPPAAPAPADLGARPAPVGRPTPTLDQIGRDLTREAREGKLPGFVGRDAELQLILETLCRQTKRNPVLVGPAGVGKTAIVEGLAQRIVRGDVPPVLHDVRLIAVQPSALVAGAKLRGALEERMRAVLFEAAQPGVVLFIDEVQSIIGAGGIAGTDDVASLLKPALARGDLACIAATTDDEYRRFIEGDGALERRFQPVRIQELDRQGTLHIISTLSAELGRSRGVQVPEDVLGWIVDFADRFLRNRHFPDKAVDLLEQCVAYGVAHGKTAVDRSDAESVAQRMVGMPISQPQRLDALRGDLRNGGLLGEREIEALLSRLAVTLRGLDLRWTTPNAVIALLGDAAASSEALAVTIARALFGASDRIITVDFTPFTEPHSVSRLIGAPPGYVGYSESLPLHRLAQLPWCVLRCENIDACHPEVRQIIAAAVESGYLTDARGKRLYLSDAVVILTAGGGAHRPARRLGFAVDESPSENSDALAVAVLGATLAAHADVVLTEALPSAGGQRRWLEQHVLADLTERYRQNGLELQWDDSFFQWLAELGPTGSPNRCERFLDDRIGGLLVPFLDGSAQGVGPLVIKREGDNLRVESAGRTGGN